MDAPVEDGEAGRAVVDDENDSGSGAGTAPIDEPLVPITVAGRVDVTIYDVARAAGVATSTVSRALSKPGRVSFKTAAHVRRVAQDLGYRSGHLQRDVASTRGTGMLAMVVADIANPVFFGMIRGAEQAALDLGFTLLVVETQESVAAEEAAANRLVNVTDGLILSSSRMSDVVIRGLAKQRPVVLLNRSVSEVTSVLSDNVHATKKATEHLVELGHTSICYLAGPEASRADGMRWRGLREAAMELDLRVRRLGPILPTMRGGGAAFDEWSLRPSTAVIAYNDLMAIGFVRAAQAAGRTVPGDVSVIGFDNIVDATLLQPRLTSVAAPLVSIGSTAVTHLLRGPGARAPQFLDPVVLPSKLVVRGSTGPHRR